MKIDIDNLREIYKGIDSQSSYFLGDLRDKVGKFKDEDRIRTILFTLPSELLTIVCNNKMEELTYTQLVKLTDTYIETNFSLNYDAPPFQQYWITLNSFSSVRPIEKYPKDWYKTLINEDCRDSYYYLRLLEEEWERSTEKSLEEKS